MISSRCLSFRYYLGFRYVFQHSDGNKLRLSCDRHFAPLIWNGMNKSLLSSGKKQLASRFNFTYRYIDDFFHKQHRVWDLSGPDLSCWTWDQRYEREQHFCLLPGLNASDRDVQSTSNFHLWQNDDFHFHITKFPFLSSKIPSSLTYDVFTSRFTWNMPWSCSSYIWRRFILRASRLSNRLLRQRYYVMECLKSSLRKFMVDTRILSNNMNFLSRMLNDILKSDHIHFLKWGPPSIRLYTEQWSHYRTRETGVACWQGIITPLDTGFRPIMGLAVLRNRKDRESCTFC